MKKIKTIKTISNELKIPNWIVKLKKKQNKVWDKLQKQGYGKL
jgi:hypothetical protein